MLRTFYFVGGGIFWVGEGGWMLFMCRWEWVGVGGGKFWVSGSEWTFLWVGGGRWRYILGGWWWMDTFFMGGWGLVGVNGGRGGLVGVVGGIFLVSGGGWTFFMGEWGWLEVYFDWVEVSGGGHSIYYNPNTNTSNKLNNENNVLKNLRLNNTEKVIIDLINIGYLKTSLCFSLKWFEINSIC